MASLDNVRDLLTLIEGQDIEYVLVTVQKNGNNSQDYLVTNFEWFDEENKAAIITAVQQKLNALTQEPAKPEKRKKKN